MWCAFEHDPSTSQHVGVVRNSKCRFGTLLDEQNRRTEVREAADVFLQQLSRDNGREIGGGFVENQDRRLKY